MKSISALRSVIFNKQQIFPSKILCVGRNYVAHIEELGNEMPEEMIIFGKPNSSITDNLRAFHLEPIHFECEICFMYQEGRFAGVGVGLDLTKRETQNKLKKKGLPWERAKAFDGSALFSEFVPIDEISDKLSLSLDIDNVRTQEGDTPLMIYKPQQILDELQTFTTLVDGDIVMTGTPQHVGPVTAGSVFKACVYQDGVTLAEKEWIAQ